VLRFDNITHQFGNGKVALKNVSFEIRPSEFLFLVGPSGAGKTTILRLLIKELDPTEGKIFLKDEEITTIKKSKIPELRRRVGAAFQDFKLLNDRTIFENISLSLNILGQKEKQIKEAVERILNLVGLEEEKDLFPAQLSGGEIQRAVIARALISGPEILFADEPTGNLDPETAWQIVSLLKEINKNNTTVMVATHNSNIVNSLKDRVIHLEKGQLVGDTKKGTYRGKAKKVDIKKTKKVAKKRKK